MAVAQILTCSRLIAEQGLTIAFAESATAGWLCSEFALAPESGKILQGGIVTYNADLKEKILGVPRALIDEFTPESEEVTREMALRLKSFITSDIQVAVTGLTTPGGSETRQKPVGTMFVYAYINGQPAHFRQVFTGSCEEVIQQTIRATADLLAAFLSKETPGALNPATRILPDQAMNQLARTGVTALAGITVMTASSYLMSLVTE
jgi:nicotinamide-nucleotide amidase